VRCAHIPPGRGSPGRPGRCWPGSRPKPLIEGLADQAHHRHAHPQRLGGGGAAGRREQVQRDVDLVVERHVPAADVAELDPLRRDPYFRTRRSHCAGRSSCRLRGG
jgi:hypothetical protein